MDWDPKNIIKEIAKDIDETRGCPRCDRVKWARGYSHWDYCVDELGYEQALELLNEISGEGI